MPNNQAKINFNAAYMAKIDKAVQITERLLTVVPPKLRAGRAVDRNRAISALWAIKQYAYVNTKNIPPSDDHTIIKHDEFSVVKIRNSKQSLKVLFQTILPARQKDVKAGYAAALDLFNQFEGYLTEQAQAKG